VVAAASRRAKIRRSRPDAPGFIRTDRRHRTVAPGSAGLLSPRFPVQTAVPEDAPAKMQSSRAGSVKVACARSSELRSGRSPQRGPEDDIKLRRVYWHKNSGDSAGAGRGSTPPPCPGPIPPRRFRRERAATTAAVGHSATADAPPGCIPATTPPRCSAPRSEVSKRRNRVCRTVQPRVAKQHTLASVSCSPCLCGSTTTESACLKRRYVCAG